MDGSSATTGSSSEWIMWSLKPGMVWAFADVPFLYYWFSAIFNLRQMTINPRKKGASLIFNVILLFIGRYLSIVLSIFLNNIKSKIP